MIKTLATTLKAHSRGNGTLRHTSFGLDTQSRDLGALRPMHHLIAPIEAVQSGIDYLQFWLMFTNNGRLGY